MTSVKNNARITKQRRTKQGCPTGVEPAPPGSQPGMQKPLHNGHRAEEGSSQWAVGSRLWTEIVPVLPTALCQLPTASVPRPGLEPGTPRSKRGMISFSPSGHAAGEWEIGRRGDVEFLPLSRSPTLLQGGRPGIRTLISTIARAALAKRSGQPYPATFRNTQWTAGELNPDLLLARQVSSLWTSRPFQMQKTNNLQGPSGN